MKKTNQKKKEEEKEEGGTETCLIGIHGSNEVGATSK